MNSFSNLAVLLLFCCCAQILASKVAEDVQAKVNALRAEINETQAKVAKNMANFIKIGMELQKIEQMVNGQIVIDEETSTVALTDQSEQQQTSTELASVQNQKDDQPKNHWSASKSDSEVSILKPNYLKAVLQENSYVYRALFAEFVLVPRFGIAYYETKIIKLQKNSQLRSLIGIGFSTRIKIYLYNNNGFLHGHKVGGSWGYPEFGEGDTVGCGLNTTSMEIIYTKNGRPLDTTNMFVFETDLLPTIMMFTPGDIIESNFGPNFVYNFSKPLLGD